MDGVSLTSATASLSINRLLCPSVPAFGLSTRRRSSVNLAFLSRKSNFSVFASKEEPKLNQWDQMELKFGRMLGEDPKLTLAKIMGKKANPEASYLEIEKSFYKNKGKLVEVEEVPFDGSKESTSSSDGLKLVKPVPKKGTSFKADNKPITSEIKKPNQPVGRTVDRSTKSRIPNVILRKPALYTEADVEDKPSRIKIKRNLSLRMGNEQGKEKFSDMTLLRKPESMSVITKLDSKEEASSNIDVKASDESAELKTRKEVGEVRTSDFTLLKKPKGISIKTEVDQNQEQHGDLKAKAIDHTEGKSSNAGLGTTTRTNSTASDFGGPSPKLEDDSTSEMQLLEQTKIESTTAQTALSESSKIESVDSTVTFSKISALQGKPKRLEQSVEKSSNFNRERTASDGYGKTLELKNHPSTLPLEECENTDWSRAEDLVKTGEREEVELVSSSTKGFVVSFGSLIGFLPYRNLAAKWKFLAFESWLRQKGTDPSKYKQNLGIIGSYDLEDKTSVPNSSLDPETNNTNGREILPDMKLGDLLRIYDQEKLQFLSSFVGQKIKVNVILADRESRKLIFSVRPKEKEESVEKKRNLMAKLRIGDVVKCCIKKITYFGIFVEVEGVPALIHQTEVSWDASLDPASYFKTGEIVEAKVHQLDFALERIFLSLKEITPDPLTEALESVVGDRTSVDGRLEAAQADMEWADVESLIKELQQIEGIHSVSKGRFFLSPGLAPTFQVYMASIFEDQYKLLARSGNRVQEVIVQASLGKEEMKSTILSCTNRVE